MAKARIKRVINVESGVVSFTELATGETLECDAGVLYPTYADFNDIQRKGIGHFINAKCGDSASDPTMPAIPQIRATWDSLVAGVWSQRGEGTGGPSITLAVEALHRVAAGMGLEYSLEDVAKFAADWKESAPTDTGKEAGYKTLFDEKVADERVAQAKDNIRAERAVARAKARKKSVKGKVEYGPLF